MQAVTWEMSPKQLAAFEKRLEKYRGLPLHKRMAKGTLAAAQYLARPVRNETPVGPTGNLRKGVKAKQLKKRVGSQRYTTLGAWVGSTAPHRHLVIRGHRIVGPKPNKVDTGRMSKANPFVDNAVKGHSADAYRIVSRVLFDKAG